MNDSHIDIAVSEFFKHIQEGFTFSEKTGIIEFILYDQDNYNFYIIVGESELSFQQGKVSNSDAVIELPLNLLKKIVNDAEVLDFRNSKYLQYLNLRGDTSLAHFIGRLARRPPQKVLNIFENSYLINMNNRSQSIVQLQNPNDNLIVSYFKNNQPAIINDLIGHWGTIQSLHSFLTEYSHCKINNQTELYGYETLGDFSKLLINNNDLYISGCHLPEILQRQYPNLIYPDINIHNHPLLWMGNTQTVNSLVTGLHRDCYDTLLCQLYCSKTLLLFPPTDDKYLYPEISYNLSQPCSVNPINPDYKKHPLFKLATCYKITLLASQVLLLPAGWFHCAIIDGPCISIAHSFKWDWLEQLD